MKLSAIQKFIRLESSGSLFLLIATLIALMIANSPLATWYTLTFQPQVQVFVNEGLMTLFFLNLSLEIKREYLIGELNTLKKAILPLIGALGGMLLPAVIFISMNYHHPEILSGWAIPTATDVAFALAILVSLKNHIPHSLKVFLIALAIIDDLGAILIIALFYTTDIKTVWLLFTLLPFLALILLNYYRVEKLIAYCCCGIFLWLGIYMSHIHAVVAGGIFALTIPLKNGKNSLLVKLENGLHPWVSYVILPIFAFTNAGLTLTNVRYEWLYQPLTLGIIVSLVFGKQFGVFLPSYCAIKLKIASLPKGTSLYQLYGASLLCGIGFTMSLFIGMMAFTQNTHIDQVKLGVFLGSLIAATLGYIMLRALKNKEVHYDKSSVS